jgi:malonyl-CoA decarboxylase
LLASWFNRGFLQLERIDWHTSATVLEKLINHESVHEIQNWADLRRRLAADRRCFAFFHPALPEEPLIFVQTALVNGLSNAIAPLLDVKTVVSNPAAANSAIFYSINNCLEGLRGISFGNFLIKQVATNMKQRFPQLKTFSTISPAPGFRDWLVSAAAQDEELAGLMAEFGIDASEEVCAKLEKVAARYFLEEKNNRDEPMDPVARFHLKNGALLERINILGNPSAKGMEGSFGTMINYVYDLSKVEDNHEKYVRKNKVICSSQVRKLLKK